MRKCVHLRATLFDFVPAVPNANVMFVLPQRRIPKNLLQCAQYTPTCVMCMHGSHCYADTTAVVSVISVDFRSDLPLVFYRLQGVK